MCADMDPDTRQRLAAEVDELKFVNQRLDRDLTRLEQSEQAWLARPASRRRRGACLCARRARAYAHVPARISACTQGVTRHGQLGMGMPCDQ